MEETTEAGAGRAIRPVLLLHGRHLPRFGFLLAAMIAELTVGPFIVLATSGLGIVRLLGVILLVAALLVAGSHRTAVVLFVAAVASHLVASFSPAILATAAAEAFRIVFLCYVLGLVVWHVLRDETITLDTVAGAACAYFLLGVVWGDFLFFVELWRPGSFAVPTSWTVGVGRDLRSALMYFSLATLTTVCFGDIYSAEPSACRL